MYDELVKKIRHCATDPMHCLSCDEDKDGRCFARLMTQAADAIEKLTAYVALYKDGGETAMKVANDYKARLEELQAAEKKYLANISALETENQHLKREREWIPMTERLPKEGEFVLVYGDLYPNKHDGGVIAVSKRMDWNYWQGFGRERNISHWMPLPTPPTAEEEAT